MLTLANFHANLPGLRPASPLSIVTTYVENNVETIASYLASGESYFNGGLLSPEYGWKYVADCYRDGGSADSDDIIAISPDGLTSFYITPNVPHIAKATEFTCSCGVPHCAHVATLRDEITRNGVNDTAHWDWKYLFDETWAYNAGILHRDGRTVVACITPALVAEAYRTGGDIAELIGWGNVAVDLKVDRERGTYSWEGFEGYEYPLPAGMADALDAFERREPMPYPLHRVVNYDGALTHISHEVLEYTLEVPAELAAELASRFTFSDEEIRTKLAARAERRRAVEDMYTTHYVRAEQFPLVPAPAPLALAA